MTQATIENLRPEAMLALAYTRAPQRDMLRIFLELDARLARLVAGTSEPMLGQMRLAWWRETLAKPAEGRPRGDTLLDAIGEHWRGSEAALVELVNGWERLLAEPPLGEEDALLFTKGREAALLAVYGEQPIAGEGGSGFSAAARRWSFADLAAKVTLDEERQLLVRLGLANNEPVAALPREARGLAVLGALGTRALKRGGRPLMEGRGASLTVLRAAIIGR